MLCVFYKGENALCTPSHVNKIALAAAIPGTIFFSRSFGNVSVQLITSFGMESVLKLGLMIREMEECVLGTDMKSKSLSDRA